MSLYEAMFMQYGVKAAQVMILVLYLDHLVFNIKGSCSKVNNNNNVLKKEIFFLLYMTLKIPTFP